MVVIGGNNVPTNPESINERCYGFECARGADVDEPSEQSNENVRLFYSDGTTTYYGAWVRANNIGTLAPSQGGLNLSVKWNLHKKRLELYRANVGLREFASTLNTDLFATNDTSGYRVVMGLFANDATVTPTTNSRFSIIEVKTIIEPNVKGVLNNNFNSYR
jgi:hypothetical protein